MELTKRQRELLRAAASADCGQVWIPRVLSPTRAQPEWEALKRAGYLEQVDGDRLRITVEGLAAIGAGLSVRDSEKPESVTSGASSRITEKVGKMSNSEPSAFEVD
jgi:hypothetical protein